MPVRDRTMLDNTIDINVFGQRISDLETEVSTIKRGVRFVGEYSTYATMITTILSPNDSDWVFITSDETKSNARTQYVYDEDTATWIYGGGATSVNNSTDTVAGIIKLSGDLSGNFNSPELKSIITGGTYAFGNNTATIDSKGRIVNLISGTTAYEWTFYSAPNTRSVKTRTLITPSYDVANANLAFYYNGFRIAETNNFTRVNSTTLQTNFDINIDDEILIQNEKFIGTIDHSIIINDNITGTISTYSSTKLESDFAKLTDDIIPTTTDVYNIGSPTNKYDNIYLVNAPTVLSDPRHKRNIEKLQINSLEFVNMLESYQYQLLDSGIRPHTGLLTPQLKKTMNCFGVDYAMYVKDSDSGEEAIRYEELISVLIQAVSQVTPWYKKLYYKIKKYFRERKVNVNE